MNCDGDIDGADLALLAADFGTTGCGTCDDVIARIEALENRIALLEFLVPFVILDFDQSAAAVYGSVRASLERKGTPIGPMDLLLAAQALSQQLILVTNNEKEFRRVAALRIENWIGE